METRINYPELQELLANCGLILSQHKKHKTMRGVGFEATIESETAPVTAIKGTVRQNMHASGRTPNEVAHMFFSLLTTSELVVIGKENAYTEKVVYEKGIFKRIPLEKDELSELPVS